MTLLENYSSTHVFRIFFLGKKRKEKRGTEIEIYSSATIRYNTETYLSILFAILALPPCRYGTVRTH